MNNHPIPQDVTGFQFRLIGNMTVKQFAYLASGCAMAFIVYTLPIFILFKLVFIPLFASFGFAMAFIPVEGRPMDAMVGYFFQALINPNQYIFHKTMGHFSFDTVQSAPIMPLPVAVKKPSASKKTDDKQQRLRAYLVDHPDLANPTDKKEHSFISNILTQATATTPPPVITVPQGSPTPSIQLPPDNPEPEPAPEPQSQPEQKPLPAPADGAIPESAATPVASLDSMPSPVPLQPLPDMPASTMTIHDQEAKLALEKEKKELKEKEEQLKKEAEEAQKRQEEEEAAEKKKAEELAAREKMAEQVAEENKMTHSKLLELEKSFQEMAAQKQAMEQEMKKLKDQLQTAAQQPAKTYVPSTAKEEPKQTTQFVRQIPKSQTVRKGVPPTPDVANILLGVVKDSSDNILPNVLIEVKDKDGNPVRAFKTNQLGQFASATPLSNGTYTIDFEDPRGKNKFDTVEIVAKGEIMQPLEVISHDLREQLRKELFS